MATFLVILHVLVCVTLVLVVLIQTGKGADIGATFGSGGSQTIFGSRGPGTFLTKITAAAGALFMITSLALAIISTHGTKSSLVEEAPVKNAAPAKPGLPAGQPAAPAAPGTAGAPAPARPAFPAPQGGK